MSNTCLDENPSISDFDSVAIHLGTGQKYV